MARTKKKTANGTGANLGFEEQHARPVLDKHRLGQLVDLVSSIGLGDEGSRSKDVLGRVYEPVCGSGGMFVPSERFIEEHGG